MQCEASERKTAAAALLGIGPTADHLRQHRRHLRERTEKLRDDLTAIREQRPLRSSLENMDYVNSLQVAQAERYVLSSDGEFALAKRMISDNPKYRGGMRARFA